MSAVTPAAAPPEEGAAQLWAEDSVTRVYIQGVSQSYIERAAHSLRSNVEVARTIEWVSAITEENSSAAEEMAAAAEELSAQAQRLQQLVARFRI